MTDPAHTDPNIMGQIGAAVGVGVAAALAAVWQWIKGAGDKNKNVSDKISLDTLELADMSSVREVAVVLREARDVIPLVKDALRSLDALHAKRDRGDVVISAMSAECSATLSRLEARLQAIEMELRVLAIRIAADRG